MSDLDKLFGDFDTRKQEEKDAKEAKTSKARQLKDETIAILESVVRPTLKELSEAIAAKGHRAEVRERFANYSYPSVGLAFYPKTTSEFDYPSESTINFQHTDSGHIKIEQKIQSSDRNKRSDYSDYSTNGQWALATVSQDKVRERVLQFIEAVLKAN